MGTLPCATAALGCSESLTRAAVIDWYRELAPTGQSSRAAAKPCLNSGSTMPATSSASTASTDMSTGSSVAGESSPPSISPTCRTLTQSGSTMPAPSWDISTRTP